MKIPAAAVVLAGGRGRRFGGNKPLAPWKKGTLIDVAVQSLRPLFSDILICAKRPTDFRFLEAPGIRVVADRAKVFHPLAGLVAGLKSSGTPWVFLRGADMPFLSPALVRSLWEARGSAGALVPFWRDHPEPLCGFYRRRTLPAARRALRRRAGLWEFLADVRARNLPEAAVRRADPRGRSFLDADTPRALAILRRKITA